MGTSVVKIAVRGVSRWTRNGNALYPPSLLLMRRVN